MTQRQTTKYQKKEEQQQNTKENREHYQQQWVRILKFNIMGMIHIICSYTDMEYKTINFNLIIILWYFVNENNNLISIWMPWHSIVCCIVSMLCFVDFHVCPNKHSIMLIRNHGYNILIELQEINYWFWLTPGVFKHLPGTGWKAINHDNDH